MAAAQITAKITVKHPKLCAILLMCRFGFLADRLIKVEVV